MFRLLVVLVVLAVSMAQDAPWFCHGIDCPNFTNSSVDSLEVRNYDSNLWTSTVVEGVDFDEATTTGFQRLFDYISGANDAGKAVDMTAPAIRCCRGTSDELSEATPLVSVNVRGSSSNINASKNSFQAIIKT